MHLSKMRAEFVYVCTHGAAAAAAQDRESEAARAAEDDGFARQRRSRRSGGRASLLHAHPGRRGARGQPLDVRPAGAAAARDGRHAVGNAARSRRRARAARERATSARSRARADGAAGTTARRPGRARASHSGRARERKEPAPDRPRPERESDADRARRRAVVALDGASCPPPNPTLRPHYGAGPRRNAVNEERLRLCSAARWKVGLIGLWSQASSRPSTPRTGCCSGLIGRGGRLGSSSSPMPGCLGCIFRGRSAASRADRARASA
jgi:hypothetical protein